MCFLFVFLFVFFAGFLFNYCCSCLVRFGFIVGFLF